MLLKTHLAVKCLATRATKKAFRSKIFSFEVCRNDNFKKLRGKTLRWLNFARVHTSIKEPDLPWPHPGRLKSPGLHWVLSPLVEGAGVGGWGGGVSKMRSPLMQTVSGFQPLAVQFCITRCQCELSRQYLLSFAGDVSDITQGPSSSPGTHRPFSEP